MNDDQNIVGNDNIEQPVANPEPSPEVNMPDQPITPPEPPVVDITPQPIMTPLSPEEKDIKLNSQIAAASYVWFLSVPIFIFRKDSPFIQRHARQGLYLFFFSILSWFLASIPYIWWIGFFMLIMYMFFAIRGFITAFNGRAFTVPFLTDYLEKGIVPEIVQQARDFTEQKKEDVSKIIRNQVNEENETLNQISSQVHDVLDDTKKE